jgi:hypothetical protein
MEQTPINTDANLDLLAMVPSGASRIVEIGCSGGGMAREYLKLNPACEYIGVEIDPVRAEVARTHCTRVVIDDIEHMRDSAFNALFPSTCWIFGDVLEHLYDPWALLRRIRGSMLAQEFVIACIPNAQHWSVQARLNCGAFVYEEQGLMDRTHIRWFTRKTVDDLFQSCGLEIVDGRGRILDESHRDAALVGVRAFAEAIGTDPDVAASDATPLQWLVRAIPV